MNFSDLREICWRYMGITDSGNKLDHIRQQINDDINFTQDDIYRLMPYAHWLVTTGTITPVTGTTTYTLNDMCVRPLAFWTADSSAHKITYVPVREADRNGLRNSNLSGLSVGPYYITWRDPTTSATASGASGSSTGVTVSEAATSLTFGSSGTTLTSAMSGSLIRINGESADYIFTQTGAHAGTIDRAYRGRLTGNGTTGAGSGATNVRWEISPIGRLRVDIFQTYTGGPTINYRYSKRHRVLIADDETPEMPEQYHALLAYGALLRNATFQENAQAFGMVKSLYDEGVAAMLREEVQEHDEEHQSWYESYNRFDRAANVLPAGTYVRNSGVY